ncbi:MAG: HEAT repeat domain-containing protein, partial [Prolixibacteraceae bacterium]|nr:HEAT repeat domain-containing protein [Prolixibacteraceae bacterium]
MDVKVTDILAQFPVKDLIHRDRLMTELTELGDEGFGIMVKRLTPPGVGDDTAVRFAINSLARYSSEFGKEEIKYSVEKNLLKALDVHSDTEIKTFLLNQLNLTAGDSSAEKVKMYLSDEQLTEPAAQCLLSIGTPAAAKALFEALPNAGEKSEITLIKALGELQYENALRAITSFAETQNIPLRKTALSALASIGNPASYKLLLNAAKKVNFSYDPTNAAEAFINYADRLGEKGETELCKKALNNIMKSNKAADKLHNYSAALEIYAKYFSYKTIPLLLKAVDSGNKPFRYSVLNIAEPIGGVAGTREWTEKAQSASA